MLNSGFLKKCLGIVSQPHFLYDSSGEKVSQGIFYQLTKFHCLINFTFCVISKYVFAISC